jgi:hypothetical protein
MKMFIPGVADDDVEERYAEFARLCGALVPADGNRIESIVFTHNAERWTATVGQTLLGEKTQTRRRKGGAVEITSPLSDPAKVLAIFPGDPYLILTDARPLTPLVSHRENPFMQSERAICSVARFEVS